MTWWAIFTLAAGTYVAKAAGPIVVGSRTVPPPLQRLLTLLSVTLLAGLVAISTFGEGRSLTLDARAAGLGVALAAVWLRAPFAIVVVSATATAAGLRALGIG
jgi:branched-subunit amino acid transport protein